MKFWICLASWQEHLRARLLESRWRMVRNQSSTCGRWMCGSDGAEGAFPYFLLCMLFFFRLIVTLGSFFCMCICLLFPFCITMSRLKKIQFIHYVSKILPPSISIFIFLKKNIFWQEIIKVWKCRNIQSFPYEL